MKIILTKKNEVREISSEMKLCCRDHDGGVVRGSQGRELHKNGERSCTLNSFILKDKTILIKGEMTDFLFFNLF